ncbi:hypothetical protein CBL_10604 [Carabus blaptoides fortunei]
MVRALDVSGELNPQKRTKVDVQLIQTRQLEDFVSSSTRRFFEITGLPSSFLDNDVETWNDDDEYKSAKSACLEIAESMYYSGWERYNHKQFRTACYMIIMRAQKQQSLKAGGLFDINVISLTSILQASFSFYTLMNNVKNET